MSKYAMRTPVFPLAAVGMDVWEMYVTLALEAATAFAMAPVEYVAIAIEEEDTAPPVGPVIPVGPVGPLGGPCGPIAPCIPVDPVYVIPVGPIGP